MNHLQSNVADYTVTEKATRLYNGVVDIFDWRSSNDVVTPFELALKQVRELPTRAGNVLVPGAGIGTYILALLQEGFKPEQITAVELDPAYSRLGYGIFNRFGINYVTADFTSWHSDMQFDVIIGNPPYQDSSNAAKNNKLWMKFTFLGLSLLKPGGYMSFVTPRSFVGRTLQPAKIRALLTGDYSLLKVNHDADSYFKVGVDICYWVASKLPYEGVTNVVEGNKGRVIDLREELPLLVAKKQQDGIAEKINEIVKRDSTVRLNSVANEVEFAPAEDGKYKVYTSGRKKFYFTNEVPNNAGQWKVAYGYSATYKGWFVTRDAVAGSHRMVYVETPEEGVAIGETLMHPVMMFYLDNWRKTAGFTPAIKNKGCLPDIRGLTDSQIQQLFELTDEEWAYIYSAHKAAKELPRVI